MRKTISSVQSGHRRLGSACAVGQIDQELRCPLSESQDTVEYVDGQRRLIRLSGYAGFLGIAVPFSIAALLARHDRISFYEPFYFYNYTKVILKSHRFIPIPSIPISSVPSLLV